jgi:hypothetical protein
VRDAHASIPDVVVGAADVARHRTPITRNAAEFLPSLGDRREWMIQLTLVIFEIALATLSSAIHCEYRKRCPREKFPRDGTNASDRRIVTATHADDDERCIARSGDGCDLSDWITHCDFHSIAVNAV